MFTLSLVDQLPYHMIVSVKRKEKPQYGNSDFDPSVTLKDHDHQSLSCNLRVPIMPFGTVAFSLYAF